MPINLLLYVFYLSCLYIVELTCRSLFALPINYYSLVLYFTLLNQIMIILCDFTLLSSFFYKMTKYTMAIYNDITPTSIFYTYKHFLNTANM